jgi:hypothetical protein
MELSLEEKAGLLMDFLQWLSEEGYYLGQGGGDEQFGPHLPIHPNYAQIIADYLDFDWGHPQAEPIALAMLMAIKNRLISPIEPDCTFNENRPMPATQDLVKAFILSQQIAKN